MNPLGHPAAEDEEEVTNPLGHPAVVETNPLGHPLDEGAKPRTNLLSSEGLSSIGRSIVPNIKQGLRGVELYKMENPDPTQQVIKTPFDKTPKEKRAELSNLQMEMQKGQEEIQAAQPENPSYPLQLVAGAAQSVAQNAPGIASAVALKRAAPIEQAILPALGLSVGQTKGQVYAKDRTPDAQGNTKVSIDNARKNADTQAAIEGTLGASPVAGLLKDMGKETFLKTMGKFVLREEMTEIPTTAWQKISDRIYAKPDQPFNEFLKEMGSDVLDTALITPLAAGGTTLLASGQSAAQDKISTIFARKEQDQAATLAKVKGDLLIDLQKRAQRAATGIDDETLMAEELKTVPVVDDRPLTEEENKLADIQLKNMKSGATDTPANPVAQADTADFDTLLTDPVYQTADDVEAKKEAAIQYDMDRGMSRAVAERRAMEQYPNALPPTQRPIAWSTNAAHVGLNLQQAAVGAGDVVILGGNEDQFSPAYTKALGETISAWSKQFMPADSRIVLNLSGLKGDAVGGYQQSSSGIHIITPRELVRTQRGESPSPEGVQLGELPITGYNAFTQQQTFGALTHEFGHALVMSSFATAMPKAYRNVIGSLDSGKVYTEQDLTQMPAPEAAVIREYQAMKLSVLDGTMTAEELVEKWLGTWKLGKDLMKAQGKDLYSYAKAALLREAKFKGDSRLSSLPLSQISALQLVHAMGRNANVDAETSDTQAQNYYLQFNEYMAEQFSRYAHANRIDEGTALGTYFKKALQSLRALFKMLKTTRGEDGQLIIKPGTSFQSWVDGMAETKAIRLAKKAKPKSSRKPRALKPKVVPDVEDLPEVVAARQKEKEEAAGEGHTTNPLEELAENPLAKELLRERVRQMFPKGDNKWGRVGNDETRHELMLMIARGELLEVEDQLAEIAASQLKLDVREAGGHWEPWFVQDMVAYIKAGEAHDWTKKAFLRYMNKHFGTANDPLKDILVPRGQQLATWESLTVPHILTRPWIERDARAALTSTPKVAELSKNIRIGEPFHTFMGGDTPSNAMFAIQDYINHVFDYMTANVDSDKWQQYDFVRAAKETAKQDEKQRKKMKTLIGRIGGTELVKEYPDGMSWVDVYEPEALKYEGDAMGHCVGGYCEAVKKGKTKIYSLRDANGEPHVTIEVEPAGDHQDVLDDPYRTEKASIIQIKGKQNLAPIDAYKPHIRDFIYEREWDHIYDATNAGLITLRDINSFPYKSMTQEAKGRFINLLQEHFPGAKYFPVEEFQAIKREFVAAENQRIADELKAEADRLRAEFQEHMAKPDAEDLGPFLDKDSGDAQEVEKALNRLGIKDTSVWKKAIDFTKNIKYYVLQIQQLAHTSNDMGLNMFNSYANNLQAMKNNMLKEATRIGDLWENLGKEDAAVVEKILLDEFHSGGHVTDLNPDANGKWSHTAGVAFIDYAKARGLDVSTPNGQALGKLILDIKNSMLAHIQIIEKEAIKNAEERYGKVELAKRRRIHAIRQLAHKWRVVPFVPQGHYGNYVVKVYERNEEGKRVLAYQGHFETAAEQDAAVEKFKKTVDLSMIRWMKIPDKTSVSLALPKDFLETLEDTGEFTSDQLSSIGDAMMPLREEKAFSKFARDASKIAGASPDMLKNYANWMEDSANFVSKMTWGRKMTSARAFTRSDMVDAKAMGDIATAREKQRILDAMEKAQQFMLHPMEEYYKTRSIVSLTFLMYSVKTALMNATGILQSWAALTSDYGEIAGNRLMGGAIKSMMSGKFSLDEIAVREKALEDGIIDQGFGYFMSGLANAGNLQRRLRPTMAGKAARLFVDTGMYLFKAVETGNRQITLMAIYRAERQRYLAQKDEDGNPKYTLNEAMKYAYTQASTKTRLLQNDYASGNRPEALRGRKSLLMIFLSYPQYMLWIMSGGYERGTRAEQRNRGQTPRSVLTGTTMRMWLIFLALAGIEGVPFGETILELLQRLWNMFGKGENIRVEGQRFLKDAMGIDSRYWRTVIQRGFLHDVLGADLSGSYSLGKPLPGLGLINPQADNWKEYVGEVFAELSGPFGGFVKGGLELGLSESIGEKELGKNLPGAAGSIFRALEAGERGVKSSRGERVLRDEKGNLREPTTAELVAIGAGFRLTEVARFQEVERLKRQSADYWNGRRIGLKHSYKRAVDDRDPQAREDVLKSVEEYNSEIPDRGLRLTGKELREYVRTFNKNVRRLESDRDPKRVRGLNRDISKVFEE